MNFALFSEISVNEGWNSIYLKKSNQSTWEKYSMTAGKYRCIADVVEDLNNSTSNDGYLFSLKASNNYAGFQIEISNAIPFAIQFYPANGCQNILGFAENLYSSENTVHTGDLPPKNSLRVDGLSQNGHDIVSQKTLLSRSFGNQNNAKTIASGTYKIISFNALNNQELLQLITIWKECCLTDDILTTVDDWSETASLCKTSRHYYKLANDLQSELKPQRAWPKPQPAYYNTDLLLEAF